MSDATPEQRFWSKVDRRGPEECWPWKAGADRHGYGRAYHLGMRHIAHRLAWQFANGRLPILFVLHRCDNPSCCNPAHLWEGTQRDNMRDMAAKGRFASTSPKKTHCQRGHELTEGNLLFWAGHRYCRACAHMRDRLRRERKLSLRQAEAA